MWQVSPPIEPFENSFFRCLFCIRHWVRSQDFSSIVYSLLTATSTDRNFGTDDHWQGCSAVEQIPGKVSGAWVFTGTRVPLHALFENLAGGATINEFVEWFPGADLEQVRTVLEYQAKLLRSHSGD